MSTRLRSEEGMALVLAMVFLMLLSILVAVLHHATLVEQFSSRKYQNGKQSFYCAEEGVREGMKWLADQGGAPEEGLSTPAWFFTNPLNGADPVWSAGKKDSQGSTYRYYIEYLKKEPSLTSGNESAKIGSSTNTGAMRHYYRITAVGASSGFPAETQVLQLVTSVTY